MCHGLYLQYARHDRFLWEVPLEERFVTGYVLDADDACRPHGNHLVDQLHRVTVRQQFADTDVVHQRFVVRVVDGSLYLMFAYFLAHQAGKLVVHCVPGACRDDTSLDRLADECHVADDVK